MKNKVYYTNLVWILDGGVPFNSPKLHRTLWEAQEHALKIIREMYPNCNKGIPFRPETADELISIGEVFVWDEAAHYLNGRLTARVLISSVSP